VPDANETNLVAGSTRFTHQFRALLKAGYEQTVVGSGLITLALWRRRDRGLVLAYHNVVPDASLPMGDRSLHLRRRDFAAQLDSLIRTHDVVPLPRLLDGSGRGKRPLASITFDDAYVGAVTLGVAEVVSRRLPATIFVAPAFVNGGTFWWDAIAEGQGALDSSLRSRALNEFRGIDAEVREGLEMLGLHASSSIDPSATVASLSQIRAAADQPGITFGAHTWSHPNLTRLTSSELTDELVRPLEWLRSHVPASIAWLAYPYGLFDARVAQKARDVGYEAAVAISGGWVDIPARNKFAIPRLNVPATVSDAGFRIRAAGLRRA
jgi:peptidoglycan/xylan/chitin deacetylase (PgdA/CDA1 family)